VTRAESLRGTLGPGIVATLPNLQAEELGRWPEQAMARPPVWAIDHDGSVSKVHRLHTDTGVLRAATASWGRVVPAGRP
jgi:hypothetical protein